MGGRPVSDIFDMFGGEDEEKPVAVVAPKKVVTQVAVEVMEDTYILHLEKTASY
jgi:hypothetical protein